MNFEQTYQRYLGEFNNYLNCVSQSIMDNVGGTLAQAMCYALNGGGKRIRPVLTMATAEMLSLDINAINPYAIAIECIHSYSLVHDDLPAMDNDDFRRGKPSTHKQFGEAMGILAGDALLNYAFEHVLKNFKNNSLTEIKALALLADYAGSRGMILGQVYDLENEKNSKPTQETLYKIYENKTAKLLTAPFLIASELAGGKYYDKLKQFGFNLGIMFQIVDDIIDEEGTLEVLGKTPHKDKQLDKLTSVKIYGLKGAKIKAEEHYFNCKNILKDIPNSDFLSKFTDNIFVRKS